MRKIFILFVFLFFYKHGISGDYCWGVMTSIGSTVRAYSLNKMNPSNKMRAIEIGGSGEYEGIILSHPKGSPNSPLFDSEKKNDGWFYSLQSKQDLPVGKIWILVSSKWKIKTRVNEELMLETDAGKKCQILIKKQLEGFDILIKTRNRTEYGYYYLGYDIQ